MRRVVVVGGGVAGMTTAYALQWGARRRGRPRAPVDTDRRDLEVLCYEAGYTPGGSVQTRGADGFVLEAGPTGLRDSAPAVRDLIRRLGLSERRAVAQAAGYQIFRAGRLRDMPGDLRGVLAGDLLPATAALRALAEPLARRGDPQTDESVAEFVSRRLGREAGALLGDLLATAACAGDPARLSMQAAFPRLSKIEAESGSLLRGLRGRPARRHGGPLVSFPQGLAELTRALAGRLGDGLRTGVGVCSIAGMGSRGFRIVLEAGPPLDADAVVLACPAADAAAVVGEHDPELGNLLEATSTARVARVSLGYRAGALEPWPAGAGFAVARGEELRMLSAEWTSNLFPGRAPSGRHLVTVVFGGALDRAALELDDTALVARARADLERAVGLVAAPYVTRVIRPDQGIPQYEIGHTERLAAIERRRATWPALEFTGCAYRGIDLGACVQDAVDTAERTLAALNRVPVASLT